MLKIDDLKLINTEKSDWHIRLSKYKHMITIKKSLIRSSPSVGAYINKNLEVSIGSSIVHFLCRKHTIYKLYHISKFQAVTSSMQASKL